MWNYVKQKHKLNECKTGTIKPQNNVKVEQNSQN